MLLREEEEILWDLFGTKSKLQEEIELPKPDPEVPTIDNPTTDGYSTKPMESRVVSLDRTVYTTKEHAQWRFTELQQKHQWKVAEVFSTVRYWCWRIYL